MSLKHFVQGLAVVTLLGVVIFTGRAALAAEPMVTEIQFITHITADLPEQDVFIESSDNPEQVVRVKGEAAQDPANLAQMVYASATPTEHDFLELFPNPLGPFPKGEPLGFTLGEWLAATGSGTYILDGNQAALNISFQNLVPNGVYSAWCGRIGFAPTLAIVDIPCGAVDGSQNVFQADAQGNATFKLTMAALPASNDDYLADIAIAYHSDGQTFGLDPGQFGLNSHVQLFIAEPPPAPVAPQPVTEAIEFITHVTADLPEQDVFIESTNNPDQVVRVKGEAAVDPANLAQTVYAAAEPVEHDFLEVGANPLGPFPKGELLGFTLGEWLAATGSGTYTLNGDQATLDLAFQNLVPNGVYTMWCGLITVSPGVAIVDIPCGAVDGSQNTFVADAQGNAAFKLTMPTLPASSDETFSDIAISYHSNGQTCGVNPCDFGLNSHVQLFISAPPPAPSAAPATLPETGGVKPGFPAVWLMLMIGAFLAGIGWFLRKKMA